MFSLDVRLFEWLFEVREIIGLDWLFHFFSTYVLWVLLVLFVFLLFREASKRKAIYLGGFFILLSILARGIVTEIIRFFYDNPRPFEALSLSPLFNHSYSPSFPSGHGVVLFSLAFVVVLFGKKKWTWTFFVLAVLSSLARVMAGVHWPIDIVGSFVVAGALFLLVRYVILPRSLEKKG